MDEKNATKRVYVGVYLAFVFALLATPVFSETCDFGSGGTTVSIAPGDESFAVVTINNLLARQDRTICNLTLYGVTIQVRYSAGHRLEPDWFYVTVPPGFRADPPQILLDDFTSGDVEIHLEETDNSWANLIILEFKVVEFVETSVIDLVQATKFLYHIKPEFKEKLVCGIEKSKPMDRNIVFHLIDRKNLYDKSEMPTGTDIFMLSAEYILNHPIWKQID
jgi:hypothetical protein